MLVVAAVEMVLSIDMCVRLYVTTLMANIQGWVLLSTAFNFNHGQMDGCRLPNILCPCYAVDKYVPTGGA